ncbi:MAG: hypothetical protein DME24_09465 [Verrucomicrobia bacterium]|nr:MAG: hypothetical protein DME24_09465 [Verrucomicrobiota bacterium]
MRKNETGLSMNPRKTSNTEHRTPNAQCAEQFDVRRWMFDVGCSMLDVRCWMSVRVYGKRELGKGGR